MRILRHPGLFVSLGMLASSAGCGAANDAGLSRSASARASGATATPSPYLYVWAGDLDAGEGDSDFLAVVDADPASSGYGTVLATAPVGSAGNDPHHAEQLAPTDGLLFANGFHGDRTFLFDLSSPVQPAFARELERVPGYGYLHSFYRLENGHVLATVQRGDESDPDGPGGLAEFDAEGGLVRVGSAADPEYEGRIIRPYSAEVFPEIDRVLTANMSMMLEPSENAVQLWRLSDLTLLATLPLPPLPAAEQPGCFVAEVFMGGDCALDRISGEDRPFEIRALPDGSAILNTVGCGFYRIHGMDTDEPAVDVLMNWPDTAGCAVPTMVGDFEVLPNMITGDIVTIDVSDPLHPVEVARITLAEGFQPHWAQIDPGTDRIAVTGIGPAATTVLMFRIDPETGALTPDEAFGRADGSGPGLSMVQDEWPHGATGPAMPHAVFFGR